MWISSAMPVTAIKNTQLMKMHLLTSFGVSKNYCTGSMEKDFQGIVQGNGVVPAMRLSITIFLVRYLHHKKVVTQFTTPIFNVAVHITVQLHAHDTDLCVFNSGGESAEVVVSKAQALLTA